MSDDPLPIDWLDAMNVDVDMEFGRLILSQAEMQDFDITRGDVNFADESLNLSLRATPREGIGISIGGVANSFLKLGGTFLAPRLEIDPTATMTTGGVAVATGGLSLLAKGLWDRMSAASGICENGEPPAQD